MTHGLARASCLFMFAALAACGGEAVDDTGDVEQTTIEAAETHLVVTVDDMAPETGHLLGWNIGRGTWYAPADDPLHPQWRTPELAAAVARLHDALDAAGLDAVNEVYPGARHGYTMADTAVFDPAATERHFEALRELLDDTL